MKRLNEIVQSDNNIHASIHSDNVAQSTADVAGDFSSGAVFESLSDHYKNYNNDDVENLTFFSGNSKDLNSYHWERRNKNTPINKNHEDTSKALDKTINKNRLDKDHILYSGSRHDPREKMNALGIVHHPAYLSTTPSKLVAQSFAKDNESDNGVNLFKIKVPKGHPAAYIGKHSWVNPGEKEVLLPRGLNLRHIKTTKYNDNNYEIKMHHMEVVP
jgi:hypothetical protein